MELIKNLYTVFICVSVPLLCLRVRMLRNEVLWSCRKRWTILSKTDWSVMPSSVVVRAILRADGSVSCVYSDAVHDALAEGVAIIARASNVEFDPTTSEWVAEESSTGEEIARDYSRSECIAAEVAYLENQARQARGGYVS